MVSRVVFTSATAQKVTLYEKCIRIVSASLSSVNLLEEALLTPQNYIKKTDTKITTFVLNGNKYNPQNTDEYNSGNAYIIALEDGSFAILDGGTGESSLTSEFWTVLSDLYHEVWGAYPTENNKIKISMWYLSHSHGDHFSIFYNFCKNYGGKIEINRLITNFPSDAESYNCHDPNLTMRDTKLSEMRGWAGGEMKYIKVHTGQKFYLANSEFEVLYTHEDMYPWAIQYFNDTGVVLKHTIHDTGSVGSYVKGFASDDTPTTMLWLGDVQTRVSQWMRAMYGSYLASDMVQVSHHGALGCEYKLYELTAAKILWWPTNYNNYTAIIVPGKTASYKDDNAKLVKMSSLQYTILGSAKNATVSIKTTGPDMNRIYQAGSGGKTYIDVSAKDIIKKQ